MLQTLENVVLRHKSERSKKSSICIRSSNLNHFWTVLGSENVFFLTGTGSVYLELKNEHRFEPQALASRRFDGRKAGVLKVPKWVQAHDFWVILEVLPNFWFSCIWGAFVVVFSVRVHKRWHDGFQMWHIWVWRTWRLNWEQSTKVIWSKLKK